MISLGSSALRIFVALEPCDMRKGFDGLLLGNSFLIPSIANC